MEDSMCPWSVSLICSSINNSTISGAAQIVLNVPGRDTIEFFHECQSNRPSALRFIQKLPSSSADFFLLFCTYDLVLCVFPAGRRATKIHQDEDSTYIDKREEVGRFNTRIYSHMLV